MDLSIILLYNDSNSKILSVPLQKSLTSKKHDNIDNFPWVILQQVQAVRVSFMI